MSEATERVRSLLPRGAHLSKASFWARHRVIVLLIALHLPVLVLLARAGDVGLDAALPALLPLAVLTALAAAPIGRLGRMLAATAALIACSVLLVHLTGGLAASHFHYFFALGLISLYQDWRPYLAAFGGVIVHHAVVNALAPTGALDQWGAPESPLVWSLLHGGFVLAVGVTHLVFWKVTEAEQATSRELWHQLYEGERALVDQLQETEAIKTELLSVVSHEFRTPLTSILGFSHTLMARVDQLDPATVRLCVANIDQQSRKLARLVHNVLAASGDIAVDPTARTDLAACAHDVAREVGDAYRDVPAVAVEAPQSLLAAIDLEAAHRVLLNLVDNAVKFSAPDAPVLVAIQAWDEHAVIEVSNVASPIASAQLDRIFQPFVQQDSSDSRAADGIGLGLHVVRRTLEAYGGRIRVAHLGGRVVFTASIPLQGPSKLAIDLRERDLAVDPPVAQR
jgi:signal transduction histidine kinase